MKALNLKAKNVVLFFIAALLCACVAAVALPQAKAEAATSQTKTAKAAYAKWLNSHSASNFRLVNLGGPVPALLVGGESFYGSYYHVDHLLYYKNGKVKDYGMIDGGGTGFQLMYGKQRVFARHNHWFFLYHFDSKGNLIRENFEDYDYSGSPNAFTYSVNDKQKLSGTAAGKKMNAVWNKYKSCKKLSMYSNTATNRKKYLGTSNGFLTGWQQASNGKWQYGLKNGTYAKSRWLTVKGKKYYFSKNGYMQTDWKKINGKYYYFDSSGAMQKSKWIGNYYVKKNGVMATKTWIGNYYVDKTGKWVPNKKKVKKQRVYFDWGYIDSGDGFYVQKTSYGITYLKDADSDKKIGEIFPEYNVHLGDYKVKDLYVGKVYSGSKQKNLEMMLYYVDSKGNQVKWSVSKASKLALNWAGISKKKLASSIHYYTSTGTTSVKASLFNKVPSTM